MNTKEWLRDHPLFAHFEADQLDELAACAAPLRLPAGTTILRYGDQTRDAFVLHRGDISIQRDTPYGTYVLASLGAGNLFGETSFVDAKPRSTDAIASSDCDVLFLNPVALSAILDHHQRFSLSLYWTFWKSLSAKLRATNQRLTQFFSETGKPTSTEPSHDVGEDGFRLDLATKRDLFLETKLSTMEINLLSSVSREIKFDPGEVIFREGEVGDLMYIVLQGRVRISKYIPGAGEEALAFVERGDFFGEMALIDNETRSADARAHSDGAVVLAIPRSVVDSLLNIRSKVSSHRLLTTLCGLIANRLREVDEKIIGWFILAGGQAG